MSDFFSYPNPVNNKAVRLVAGGVVILALVGPVSYTHLTLPTNREV